MQVTIGITVNCVVMLAAGTIAGFLGERPAWLRIQRYLMGTVLTGLAVHIAADRSKALVPA
ncbi:hypothetical protein [Kitasatospora sp. NPDC057015]|uniref:hypothetical protein n=1 Tax=Kitasatospora sp. NPDC057015 TaxID=3346001 RepID=UPI003628A3A2